MQNQMLPPLQGQDPYQQQMYEMEEEKAHYEDMDMEMED